MSIHQLCNTNCGGTDRDAPQEAMVTGGCRGGFSTGELIAFLYARSFPKAEWSARVREAFNGSESL